MTVFVEEPCAKCWLRPVFFCSACSAIFWIIFWVRDTSLPWLSFSESETWVSLWLSLNLFLILPCGHGMGDRTPPIPLRSIWRNCSLDSVITPIPKNLCRLNQQQSFPFLAETSALKLNGGFRFWLYLRSQNVSNTIVIESSLSP